VTTRSPSSIPGAAGTTSGSLRGAIAFLVAFAGALYVRQLLLGETFVLRDHIVYTWTERAVLANGIRAGRVPEWNDLVGFGTQFAASSANGVTYPPLWMVALFPLPFSMDLVVALHVLLAGIGTAFLARRLGAGALGAALAGVALMGSGYVASIAPNKVFAGTAWIPWVAWAADRVAQNPLGRRDRLHATTALAATLAAQHLAGDPASSITGGLVALSVVLSRATRRGPALGRLALASCASLLLASASLLPGLALLPHTTRSAISSAEGASWSLHPWRLLELVWPRELGDPIDRARSLAQVVAHAGSSALEPSWSFSVFVGVPVLALAALAALRGRPGIRGLAIAAAALVLLALGVNTPLYDVWRTVFPPERIIRYPEKHLAGAIVLICAVAGAGLSALQARPGRAAAWTLGVAGAPLALSLAAVALLRSRVEAGLQSSARFFPALDVAAGLDVALRAGFIALAVAVAVSLLFLAAARWRTAAVVGVGVIALHLLYEGWAVTPVAAARRLVTAPGLLGQLVPLGGQSRPPPRILRSPLMDAEVRPEAQAEYQHETLLLDSPGRFGVAAVPGFEGWRSRELAAFWARAGGMPVASLEALFAIDAVALPSELRRSLFPSGSGDGGAVVAELMLKAGSDGGAWSLVRSEGIRSRAFVAPRWRWSSSEKALAATVDPSRGDPGLVLLTGSGAPSPPENAALPMLPCEFASYRPERIELSCTSPASGFAVLVEENAPGWTATVDGMPTKVETGDVLLRAVEMAPGTHRIVFAYRTPLLCAGVLVSVLAWIAWGVVVRWGLHQSGR